MSEELIPWAPRAHVTRSIRLDDFTITFKRTTRVPDNDESTELPPDMGSFPLFKVDDYAENLPVNMAQKGGLFLPMYQREALWIDFESDLCYAIKIYVGGVNVVSGEPAIPNPATALRRRNLLKNGETLQDYIVVPDQPWLDGIAVEPGKVRQFVAMPVGTGHSVEAQMTGEETTAGIQFEVTRLDKSSVNTGEIIQVRVSTRPGKLVTYNIGCKEPVAELERLIQDKEGIDLYQQEIFYDGFRLREHERLSDYDIDNNTILDLRRILRGGGGGQPPPSELSIAAGGCINQSIVDLPHREYRRTVTATFNVQILNSASFEQVTGKKPPRSPVTAKIYAECGYPFYSIYEEPTSISGNFSNVQSIAQIDRNPDQPMPDTPIVDVTTGKVVPGSLNWTCNLCGQINNTTVKGCKNCLKGRPGSSMSGKVGLFNPRGPSAPLKLAWEMAEEVGQMHTAF